MKSNSLLVMIAICTLMMSSAQIHAEEDSSGTGWQYSANIYLFALSIGGETSAGDDIDVGFDDLWDNLNFAVMGWMAARNGNWLVFGDVQYANLEGGDSTTANLGGQPVNADLDIEIIQWVLHAGGGYTVSKSQRHMTDVIAGVRYIYQDTDFKFDIGAPQKLKVSESADNIDAIIGINNNLKLNNRWYLQSYLDVGTGESKFTWQGMALLGYQFSSVDALLGYRHIYWNFDGSKGLGKAYDDLDFSGPIAGVKFSF